MLLGQGAAAEVDDQEQWNALHCAAKVTPNFFSVTQLYEQGGFLQVVVLLTNAGSTTTEKTSTGKTPLWYACIDQHKGCVEFLLRYSFHIIQFSINDSLKKDIPMTRMTCSRMKSLSTIS